MKTFEFGKESSDIVVLPEGATKAELSARYNDLYDARVKGNKERFETLKTHVAGLLKTFSQTEASEHENPDWIRCVMEGGFLSALGDYQGALIPERRGWEHAAKKEPKNNIHYWISAFNISDELRRTGDCHQALIWAERALNLNPSHPFSYLNVGLCMAAVGRLEAADHLFRKLIEIADFESESDGLAARLIYEREFDQFNNLPSVKVLKQKIATRGGDL